MSGQDGYDSALSALRNNVEVLAISLAIWGARDDTRPDAHARRAANDAMNAVDAMLQALHALRQSLVSDIRNSDDRSAERADKLLARTDDAMTSSRDQAFPEPAGPGETEGPEL